MTRKRALLLALAWVVAYIMGQVLGRGLAWLHVYSEPRKTWIIQFEDDSERQGDCNRQQRARRTGKLTI